MTAIYLSPEFLQGLPFIVLGGTFLIAGTFQILLVVANWLHGHAPLRDEDEELGWPYDRERVR